MPWNGSGTAQATDGTFTGTAIWTAEKNANQLVTAGHFDSFTSDLCSMLNNTVTRDGQGAATVLAITATVNASSGVITFGGVTFANTIITAAGAGNTFLNNSGNFTLSGAGNIGIGYGPFNVTYGNLPLSSLTTGNGNIALGGGSLSSMQSGNSNTALGSNCMQSATGSTNTGLGGSSVGQLLTSGSNNTFLGAATGQSVTTGSRNIAIGAGADINSATSSGQINIACTIWGTGCTTTGASAGTGKIGINNSTPTYTFDVATGDIGIGTLGKTLRIAEGANAKMGSTALVAGSKVVSTTAVTANSRIFVTSQADGGSPGFLRVSTRTAGTSFTVTSSSGTDTSTFAWFIVEPY